MMKSMKAGFTLAEVLTTLMVIGVVAAMTIPTLMNSTSDQQAKVAAKKAASVLGQAVQLLRAREVECTITTARSNEDLASCMATVMSGSVSSNTITTPDGMVFAFYAPSPAADMAMVDVCGDNFTIDANSWHGGGNCAVVVDTNGLGKGTKSAMNDTTALPATGFAATKSAGTDRLDFSMSMAGVRPMVFDNTTNKGYEYLYGSAGSSMTTAKLTSGTKMCCPEGTEPCETDNTKYPKTGCYTRSTCQTGEVEMDKNKTGVESCPAAAE
ncbi:MAG: type II secretion system GspH family protein [Candidatus Gastranaerophilales bacterium]|nr:type II secretion system GspH family protein [Candidatus Gastranaerophilales bacterium]